MNAHRTIRAGTIDHDQLDVRMRLGKHAMQRLPDHRGHIPANGDEGDTH